MNYSQLPGYNKNEFNYTQIRIDAQNAGRMVMQQEILRTLKAIPKPTKQLQEAIKQIEQIETFRYGN